MFDSAEQVRLYYAAGQWLKSACVGPGCRFDSIIGRAIHEPLCPEFKGES